MIPICRLRLPRAPFFLVGEGDVIRYRPHEIYLVASYLRPVMELPDESDLTRFLAAIVPARCALTVFTGDLIDKFLPNSKQRAEWLIKNIDDITFHRQQDGFPNLLSLQTLARQFETLLDEELSAAPVFCLERIGNFSTDSLLNGGSAGFDPEAIAVIPDRAISEIDEAGRCLAFERSTASGFHILRAVELTIRHYLGAIPGFTMPPLNRQNWGEFLKLLQGNGAPKEVTDALQNIKDNYRNPLMHPEDVLELRQAIALFSVCQGMIEILVENMKKRGLA